MLAVSFGGDRYERVEIDVAGYERTEKSGEYFDDNWLRVRVTVAAGAFGGTFDSTFQTAELSALRAQLSALCESLKGSARFETLEGQLTLSFEGNGRGSVELRGEALDQAGIGNRLSFKLSLDQTQIGAAVKQLDEILSKFPVRDV